MLVGCGPHAASEADGPSGSSGRVDTGPSTSSTDEGSTGPAATSTSSSTQTTGAASTGPTRLCGNGRIDPGERCDGEACSPDCLHPTLTCHDAVLSCGNTIDDDRDGLTDLDDLDCLSPCDHDEAALAHGIESDAQPEKLDCYWDDSGGPADDGCVHDLRCDPESPGEPWFYPYDPNLPFCAFEDVSEECTQACVPLTPNGCDCFGCCEVDGKAIFLGLRAHADMPKCAVDSVENCSSCTIQPQCFNPCDRDACELCFLDAPTDLRGGCAAPACDPGVQPCIDSYTCPEQTVCLGGCCLPFAVTP